MERSAHRYLLVMSSTFLAAVALVWFWSWYAVATPALDPRPLPAGAAADLVVVEKADRVLTLYHKGAVLKRYRIALGGAPVGHKIQEGDNRTPEGRYVLDWRNAKSQFTLALHISYPAPADRAQAAARGVSPGGDIFIHGQPTTLGAVFAGILPGDWTAGCIAMANADIREVWSAVRDGTPIEIRP